MELLLSEANVEGLEEPLSKQYLEHGGEILIAVFGMSRELVGDRAWDQYLVLLYL